MVARTADRTPRLRRITLTGRSLGGFDAGLPGASVRLLLPPSGEAEPEIPTWTGNEFLAGQLSLNGGQRVPLAVGECQTGGFRR